MEWGSGKIQERVGAFQSEEERGIKAGWSWTRENCGYETVRWRGSPQRFIRLHGLWWVDCILKCKKNKKNTGWCVKNRLKPIKKRTRRARERAVSVVVMISFVCQLDRATGCSDILSNITLSVSVKVNTWTGRLRKADFPPSCGWALTC